MRQITLNNALKEKNVWFRVTPEQALQTQHLAANLDYSPEIVESISDIVALGLINNPTRIGFCFSNEFLSNFMEKVVIPNTLEQIQIIDEVPFKTQKEVWEFLVSNEGNVVEHTLDGRSFSFVNGELRDITNPTHLPYLNLKEPKLWKPSSELYKPKSKEWWELNGNKPTLCWYSDDLEHIKAKTAGIGLCVKKDNYFYNTYNPILRWKYAVPLTLEEFHKFAFKPLEN